MSDVRMSEDSQIRVNRPNQAQYRRHDVVEVSDSDAGKANVVFVTLSRLSRPEGIIGWQLYVLNQKFIMFNTTLLMNQS